MLVEPGEVHISCFKMRSVSFMICTVGALLMFGSAIETRMVEHSDLSKRTLPENFQEQLDDWNQRVANLCLYYCIRIRVSISGTERAAHLWSPGHSAELVYSNVIGTSATETVSRSLRLSPTRYMSYRPCLIGVMPIACMDG